MEITGYFLAPETGSYTFTLGNVDDSAGLLFDQDAFGFCEQNDITATTTNFLLNAIKGCESGKEASVSSEKTLIGGLYYPIRIIFSNAITKASLDFSATLPNGTVINDFTNYIYTFGEDESYCPAFERETTTYTPWTGSFTSTIGTIVTISVLTHPLFQKNNNNNNNGGSGSSETANTPVTVIKTSVFTTSGSTITSVITSTIVPNNNNENGSGSPGNASEYVETISSGFVYKIGRAHV
ncbi:uncharacterized protein SCODWIG_03985 [Saccharomycodes ludwigii]|uniref:PA14 domain-containing protein n=1 Tax=Saccharomycodes ludwigii TaxID=36035 RepID=A0A376BC08_9ASCO|nr:uncharacterized protein SCODWIG_03985 [Saccharomycodes ludwigii]